VSYVTFPFLFYCSPPSAMLFSVTADEAWIENFETEGCVSSDNTESE